LTGQFLVSSIVPWLALFVSILAIGTSIWSGSETRKHDRYSLQPGVSYIYRVNNAPEGVGIFLENNGSGPARISETRVYLDNKYVDFGRITDQVVSMYAKERPTSFYIKKGYVLGSGKEVGLYVTPVDNVKDWDGFRNLIWNRIFVIFKVCSMYNECFYVCLGKEDEECEPTDKRLRSGK
jgi:hypothetical protein